MVPGPGHVHERMRIAKYHAKHQMADGPPDHLRQLNVHRTGGEGGIGAAATRPLAIASRRSRHSGRGPTAATRPAH